MNEPRPVRRPANDPRATRRPPQHPNASGYPRRRRRRRRPNYTPLIILVILLLAAMGIGYLMGFLAGKASAAAGPTEPSTASEPTDPTETTPPPDTTPPEILGVNKLSMFTGGTIAYRRGVLVVDDLDPKPQLTVDNSQVDLSTPGVYPLIYTATDSAGNVTTAETTITVEVAPDTYVDEATIKATADRILSYIIKEGMTKEEQVNAIYDYMANRCGYINDFDKTDYMQAAYLMMTENQGDCFGFYALSRLMFERLDIDNLSVTRMKNELRTTSHYWNMVSLDDGETWYHFDATPHFTYPTRTCLITDADLEEFNELMPGYYYFDHEAFPASP